MKSTIRNDKNIAKLIEDVQAYSEPEGKSPTPPTEMVATSQPSDPTSSARAGPDRQIPPNWFESRDPGHDELGVGDEVMPAISGEIDVPVPTPQEEGEIAAGGMEALAFYAPFHFYDHDWGIYIRDFGVAYIATRFLRRQTLTAADNWVIECAYQFLLDHEYAHFQAEVAVSRYELLFFQRTMYLKHAYQHHFLDRYSSWLEESVANARAYQEVARRMPVRASVKQIDAFRSFLGKWMKTQPSGYRDYDQWSGRNGQTRGRFEITRHLHESLAKWRHKLNVESGILDLYRDATYSKVPITRIHDNRLNLGSVRYFPKAHGLRVIVWSNDHPPPHIHVDFLNNSKPVRVVWPSLLPLRPDRQLTGGERRNLYKYLERHQASILERLRTVFCDQALVPAIM